MKYIIFERPLDNGKKLVEPVMFPEHIAHASISNEECVPVSAGFYYLKSGRVRTYGGSSSMNLESRSLDRIILSNEPSMVLEQ